MPENLNRINTTLRPNVMSIAGLDPSAGAGLLADIKTFEQNGVYGLGVCSAVTLQTEHEFFSVRWTETEELLEHIRKMLSAYPVRAVKTGIMPSLEVLEKIVRCIHDADPAIKIIVDPVLRSSTGFDFMQPPPKTLLDKVLPEIFLLTPNAQEATWLSGETDIEKAGTLLSEKCAVLLKGGHNETETGTDLLFLHGEKIKILPAEIPVFPKHGSGCVLSSAIAAQLALGKSTEEACRAAKVYTEKFLARNEQLLGYHA